MLNKTNLVLVSALMAAGCSGYAELSTDDLTLLETELAQDDAEEFSTEELGTEPGKTEAQVEADATLEQKIRGGIATNHRGVIELSTSTGSCTGVLISHRYALTSAHCVYEALGRQYSGDFDATISYFDPDTGKRRITGANEELHAVIKSSWRPSVDVQSDIALIRRDSPWTNTDGTDYHRLSLGSCSQIDKLNFYGRGPNSNGGTGAGTLRYMPWDNAGCETHQFYGKEGTRAVCRGDSGGPHLVTMANGYESVAGLHSYSQKDDDGDFCAGDGKRMYAMRMNSDKVNWIKTWAQFTTCNNHHDGAGHSYVKCF